ncbi:MAG: bifunctional demethylmenaquinone methyltransferase/2-methoxy-6-polyprenyl-1,4-benzoquinol methylase UbiE [Gammaproteobacteria bacterium]|nr:bifunctional demethylmenaquinone methyltransferase/2-methoxy-6-polyprenyl-1,4-benzoquinol methylase UbiE [Gammaproteobacteria bacterium]
MKKQHTIENETTHFGFTSVPIKEKANRVADVFHSVASKYDLMNDVMSVGLHRLWKRFTIAESAVCPGQKILDIAGGTGDLAQAFSKKVGMNGYVVLADINEKMLHQGRERLIDKGVVANISYVQADAEKLPFPDNYFDCITIAFGLRNVTDKACALRSMYRVLKPGGRLLILEFSKPIMPLLNTLYDTYSFKIIPKLGAWITGDEASYQYLVESIRMHPDQITLQNMMLDCEFEDVVYHNLTGGVVALHKGFKY